MMPDPSASYSQPMRCCICGCVWQIDRDRREALLDTCAKHSVAFKEWKGGMLIVVCVTCLKKGKGEG